MDLEMGRKIFLTLQLLADCRYDDPQVKEEGGGKEDGINATTTDS